MVSTANPWDDDEYDPNDDPMCGFNEYGTEPSEIETDPQYGSLDRWYH